MPHPTQSDEGSRIDSSARHHDARRRRPHLCRSIRETSQIRSFSSPQRAKEVDRIIGLEMGATITLQSLSHPREIDCARRCRLRRTQALRRVRKPPEAARIRFGDWTLDTGQRELVGTDGVAIPLSKRRVPAPDGAS